MLPNLPADVLTRVEAVRKALNAAKFPAEYAVSREDSDAVEAYLLAEQAARRAEWAAAGSPDDWPYPLAIMFVGPHMGLMFKGVELRAS